MSSWKRHSKTRGCHISTDSSVPDVHSSTSRLLKKTYCRRDGHDSGNFMAPYDGISTKIVRSFSRAKVRIRIIELLIHPSHLKYDESRRMPYFVMIDRLRGFLRHGGQPVALFISGYSFGDEHLNAAIVESLNANASAACFTLQHGVLENYPNAIALAKEHSNLSVLASDRAIIRRQEGPWTTSATTEQSLLQGVFDVAAAAAAAPGARRNCTHLLGDFKAFGEFLDQFSGLRLPLDTAIA